MYVQCERVENETVGKSNGKLGRQEAQEHKSRPRVLLDLSDDTCQRVADFLDVVNDIGKWPATASCMTFFLLPNDGRRQFGRNVGVFAV